ncbi:hypothetical protein HaLaN_31463 [Haematococcus lacustris]|uniref:Uncharacterized protein n=1 Tax=Haematococcus lacustris TaxID=44745 RepID=A0A6A0AH32_HAELA|nr:hypothetical protein HaLaN_31463 [Haematococcus lacustris]
MRSLLHELTCSPRPWLSIGWGFRPAVLTVTDLPSRTTSAPTQVLLVLDTSHETGTHDTHPLPLCLAALRQYDSPPRPKQDMGELIIAVMKLPYLDNSRKVEQTSQLLWHSADWARQPENSRAHVTQVKSFSELELLQRMAGEPLAGTAGSPPAPLEQFDARQLNMAAWSLGKLKPHLLAAAVTPRPGHSIGCGYRLGGHLRSSAPRTCLLPSIPSRTLSSSAHSQAAFLVSLVPGHAQAPPPCCRCHLSLHCPCQPQCQQ